MSITMKYYGRPASEQAVSGATAATTVYYLCSLQIVLPLQWFGRSRSLELITVDFCQFIRPNSFALSGRVGGVEAPWE